MYWGMREVDRRLWHQPTERMRAARVIGALDHQVLLTTEPGSGPTFAEFLGTHRIVATCGDRELVWVAPRWVAWLYRWLPDTVTWAGAEFDAVTQAPYYLWAVRAPRWYVGWLPRRRRAAGAGRWGILVVGAGAGECRLAV